MKSIGVLFAALGALLPATGQPVFSNFATNADGSVLGFSLASDMAETDGGSSRIAGDTRLLWVSGASSIVAISNDGRRIQIQRATRVLVRRPAVVRYNFEVEEAGKTLWTPGDDVATYAWMNLNGRDIVWWSSAGSRLMLTDLTTTPPATKLLPDGPWNIWDRLADGRFLVATSEAGLEIRSISDAAAEPLLPRPVNEVVWWKSSPSGGRIL